MGRVTEAGRFSTRIFLAMTLGALLLNPAVAQDIAPPKVSVTTPGGINISDGSIEHSQTDLAIGPLSLERFHRSGTKQPNDPMFGRNFSSNFDIYVARKVDPSSADYLMVHIGNSASGPYSQQDSIPSMISGTTLDAQKGRLTWNGSQFVYYDSGGTAYTFSTSVTAPGAPWAAYSRRIERIDFPDGRRQTFTYSGTNLKLVEDSTGYAMVFDYNANGDVTAACAFKRSETYVGSGSTCAGAALKTGYGYTYVNSVTKYVLTSVTDVMNQVTTYAHSAAGVTCIQPPGYASCTVSQTPVGPSNTVSAFFSATQTLTDQGTWTVSGEDDAGPVLKTDPYVPVPYDGHLSVTVTDPAGNTSSATFTLTSPYTIADALGRGTRYTWKGGDPNGYRSYGSMLTEAIFPEGDKYQAEYSGPLWSIGKERHVSKDGSSVLEKLYLYGSCTAYPGTYQNCTKPIAIRDPAGNWTDYTYAPHGGILTEMQPAPVANGARPLKVTTWTQRYSWIRNSVGSLVQGSLPVWVKASETVCQTVAGASPAPTCDASAPQTVTTYEYGANGTGQSLLVKGVVVTAQGTSLRTCYGYDQFDRKIYETQPNANLASCS